MGTCTILVVQLTTEVAERVEAELPTSEEEVAGADQQHASADPINGRGSDNCKSASTMWPLKVIEESRP